MSTLKKLKLTIFFLKRKQPPRTPKGKLSCGSLQKTNKSTRSNQFVILDDTKNHGLEEIKREDANYFSASSSEVCSLPSKMRSSKCSFRSGKNQENEAQPFWFFGNKTNSFNRKYGVTRPRSGGKVVAEKAKDWNSNTSSASGSRCTTPRYKRSTSPEKKNLDAKNNELEDENVENSNLKNDGNENSQKETSVPLSNTTFDKSNSTLPATNQKSLTLPTLAQIETKNSQQSSARANSRSRYSESHLPVFIKNHLSRNRLNSDSLLAEKEDFNRKLKSADGPKSCPTARLQRPKTASSILCGDSTRKVEPNAFEKDDALKRRGIKRAVTPNIQIMKKNSQSASSRDFDEMAKSDSQVCEFHL